MLEIGWARRLPWVPIPFARSPRKGRHATQTALKESTPAVCSLGPCGIQNRMTYLVDFGGSGKNFIEIGKRSKVQETMLRLALPLSIRNFAA